jgi:hypothetical protein
MLPCDPLCVVDAETAVSPKPAAIIAASTPVLSRFKFSLQN